jgi:hypothetical protein
MSLAAIAGHGQDVAGHGVGPEIPNLIRAPVVAFEFGPLAALQLDGEHHVLAELKDGADSGGVLG